MPPFNAPSWKMLINGGKVDVEFGSPVSEEQLAATEHALGMQLPDSLRELLFEADGINADRGCGVIWPAAEIQRRNQEFRSLASFRDLYMPFDHLLFFGDDIGGDQFAFAIHADRRIHKPDVFRWEHETDARTWCEGCLEHYLESRLK